MAERPGAARERFPKASHLLKHADFERVYQRGRRHFSASLTLFWARREAGPGRGARIGFTVSKAMGGSVVRNRMRRRMREAVRRNLAVLRSPLDVVINPRKLVLETGFEKLRLEVRAVFQAVEAKAAGSSAEGTQSQEGRKSQ